MTTTSELVAVLRIEAEGLGFPVRFMIEDACDRLERKSRDNELLMQAIAELRSRTVKTNADRYRAMSDEELAETIPCPYMRDCYDECKFGWHERTQTCEECKLDWLKQPVKDGESE